MLVIANKIATLRVPSMTQMLQMWMISRQIETKMKILRISEGFWDSLCSKSERQMKMIDENKFMAASGTETFVFGVQDRAVTHNSAT
jgi:hypothetical protein